MALRVRILGGLDVEGVNLTRLSSRKARRVLARLAVAHGGPVTAEALADVVWGDEPPSHPGDQLAVLISRLRSALGADRIPRSPAGYRLHSDWLDVTAVVELTTEARRRLDSGAVAPAIAAARAALDLLRGPVLPEEPPETAWLEAERAEADRYAAAARLLAAQAVLAGGDPWHACELAQHAVDAEPYDEAALRTLMCAQERAGRPALALKAYAVAAERLADELGVDPSPETRALHVRLLRGTPAVTGSPAPVSPTLPGRAGELALLGAAYERARAGAVELVRVEGEAGIGKTRLVNEFTAGLTGALVLTCRGDELGGGLPRALLDAPASRSPSPREESQPLREVALPTTVATFAGNPDAGLGRMFAAVDAALLRLADGRPVVLFIDDAHLIDTATRAWLKHVTQGPLLVLAAQRLGEGTPVTGGSAVTLGPLDAAAAALALGLPAGSPRLLSLVERSGGHPMFLWELYRSGAGARPDELPATIREAVRQRCERAGSPGMAATLRAAAVLGPEVDLELLAAVLDEPVKALLDQLEEGARRHLLAESGSGFQFAHQLVRESLGADISAARRALLHRQAARILAARPSADPLAVAHHARLGGDPTAAAAALARAAEVAAGRYDLDEAARLLDEAVSLNAAPELLVRRARVRLRIGDTAGASADARTVREDPSSPAYPAALEVAALVSYVERDFARCVRLAEEGAGLATEPEIRASCLALAGRVRHATGDLASAAALFDQVDAPASVAPLVETWRGFLLVHTDDPAAALRLVSADEPTRVPVGYPFVAINRHLVAGYARARQGEPLTALREFEEMSATAARERTDRFAGRSENFRGWILRGVGAFGAADEANTRAYERCTANGSTEPLVHALLDLADGRLRAGDPDGAAEQLSRLDGVTDQGYVFAWRAQLRSLLVSGRLALATGSFDEAAGRFERALSASRGLRRYEVLARVFLAQAVRRRPAAADVSALDSVAPLEAWWITADLARQFDVDSWRRLAEQRVAALAARSGPYADTLRAAARRLG